MALRALAGTPNRKSLTGLPARQPPAYLLKWRQHTSRLPHYSGAFRWGNCLASAALPIRPGSRVSAMATIMAALVTTKIRPALSGCEIGAGERAHSGHGKADLRVVQPMMVTTYLPRTTRECPSLREGVDSGLGSRRRREPHLVPVAHRRDLGEILGPFNLPVELAEEPFRVCRRIKNEDAGRTRRQADKTFRRVTPVCPPGPVRRKSERCAAYAARQRRDSSWSGCRRCFPHALAL
jgi:hypothetical protein